MNFLDFFWMNGRPGIFWAVELGAFAALAILLFLFPQGSPTIISCKVETEVKDKFPTVLIVGTVVLLILASFLPRPEEGFLASVHDMRSGLICAVLCIIGVVRSCIKINPFSPLARVAAETDTDTLLLLFGLL